MPIPTLDEKLQWLKPAEATPYEAISGDWDDAARH
jgi:hypothetical protein